MSSHPISKATRSIGTQTEPIALPAPAEPTCPLCSAVNPTEVSKDSWEQRLIEAVRLGLLAGAFSRGKEPSRPVAQRWPGYKNRVWAIAAPREARGTYSSWASAQPFVQDTTGAWLDNTVCYGFASKKECTMFLDTFSAATEP